MIENLVEQLDKWVNFTDQETKQIRKVGLSIRYSTTKNKWFVCYGKKQQEKHSGIGDTIEEALKNKIDKLNQDATE